MENFLDLVSRIIRSSTNFNTVILDRENLRKYRPKGNPKMSSTQFTKFETTLCVMRRSQISFSAKL